MNTKPLAFDLIRIDAGTQSRIAIHEDTVEDYAEVIRNTPPGEWPFPPLDVFHDGSEYFMASGFHRMLGAKRGGRESAPCVIHKGTAQDARIFGMTANDINGLRMSRADKRACVEWLLDNGGKMSRKDIADKAGVSIRTVDSIIADRKPKLQIAVSPPQKDANAAPDTPNSGENNAHDNAHIDAHTAHTATPHKAPPKEIKELTPEQSAAWHAQQQIKIWADTIGRWMSGHPSIDEYRDKFPGRCGDRVINATKELWEALEAWKKVVK